MALIWKKRAIFDLLFILFSHQEKSYKKSYSTYITHIGPTYMYFAHPIDFFDLPILKKKKKKKKTNLSGMVTFRVSKIKLLN